MEAKATGGHGIWSRLRDGVKWVFTPEQDPRESLGDQAYLRRVRVLAAFGIVLVSALSAAALLRGSVFDERAAQHDALFRQLLVNQQQAQRTHERSVAEDVAGFGRYEEHTRRASQLVRAAGGRDGRGPTQLLGDANDEHRLAAADLLRFRGAIPREVKGTLTFDPATAYRTIHRADSSFEALSPQEKRREAKNLHVSGVHLTGVAVLFIFALLLLTLAEVFLESRVAAERARAGSACSPAWAAASPSAR